MKHNRWKDKLYRELISKIFKRMTLVTVLALAVMFLIRMMGDGRMANFVTELIARYLKVDFMTASTYYWIYIRTLVDYVLIASAIVFFLLFFRILLSWFTKYFDEIIIAVDELTKQDRKPIVMSPEMAFMSQKLNEVKLKLERSADAEREAEERKNELVMYLAHDIRTPLTSVLGYLSLLNEVPDMPAEQRAKYVGITLDKAVRLEKLINEFFEITQYHSQQIKLNREWIDLHYLLEQVLDEFYPVLSSRGNTAVLEAGEKLNVMGDGEKLARVFSNLLKNAAAYSYPRTQIKVTAVKKRGGVEVCFRNRGKTIPKEKLEFLFNKFYRLNEARSSDTGGAGLGLSIAKEIVDLHGGSIAAGSSDETVTFRVWLPEEADGDPRH